MSGEIVTVGIRREDKNEWERRAPLTPHHVSQLARSHGLALRVQPSSLRTFPDSDYRGAGAAIDEELSACGVILGIKEVPPNTLLANKTYLFFSHTTKGQRHNMPLLRRLMQLGCTLIDFERIADHRGKRLIFFGRHAGYAGMLDALWALGRRLAAEGYATALEEMRLAHQYTSLDEATRHVSRVGRTLRQTGLPSGLAPLVCGFTGSGNVFHGAFEIFGKLPSVDVHPDELERLFEDPRRPPNLLYRVHFGRGQRFVRVGGGPVRLAELMREPDRFRGGLGRWLPYLTLLVHGAFWEPPQPSLVSLAELRDLWSGGQPRLRVIADISMDIRGGIEATVKAMTPGEPVFVYDVERDEAVDGIEGRGPVILAVDNLPGQLSVEASEHFGASLVRYVPALARCPWDRPLAELPLPAELVRAVVVHRGALTPNYSYLEPFLDSVAETAGRDSRRRRRIAAPPDSP